MTGRPRLLDLFCCEGGAGLGYAEAGFTVFGVDLDASRLKRYPFQSVQADALEYLRRFGAEFDAVHASPPCQGYSVASRGSASAARYPRLIAPVREALQATGKPYVIENVKGSESELRAPTALCGCQFDLTTRDTDGTQLHLRRLRLFETNFPLSAPRACRHDPTQQVAGAYDGARRDRHEARNERHGGYVPKDKGVVAALLGLSPTMTWKGLYESVPPAYTRHVGLALRTHLDRSAP